jgi:hypothetical protein
VADSNTEMLRRVAEALRPLDTPVVFVGGATIALYLEPYAASQMRVTLDVDCVAATSTLAQHQELEAKLRELGFRHCLDDDAPTCRWRYEELIVDVMPLDASVLGFASHFSQLGFPLSEEREIAPGTRIHVLPPRYLFASKIEAYRTRGTRDPYESKDLEDLVSLLDGAPAMIDAIESENDDLRRYVAAWAADFLRDSLASDLVAGHVTRGPLLQERIGRVQDRLRRLAGESA